MVKNKRKINTLFKKQLRDLLYGWKSFLAILIICMLAVTLYVGLDATWRCIDADLTGQYQQSNMADLWIKGEVSDRTVRDIQSMEGVQTAQRRISEEFEAKELKDSPKITLIANEDEPTVCLPLLREGRLPANADECMLSQRFAQAQGLEPGDRISLSQGDRRLELTITGLGLMPEYVTLSNGDEMIPPPHKRGYAYVPQCALDSFPYTEIAAALTPDADAAALRAEITAHVSDYQTLVIPREDIMGIKLASEQAQQIRAMGAVFPMVFFLVAALITWTTMSRLVESQRLQIGSLFAIGYGRSELLRHYAGYGLLVGSAGLVLGLLAARYGLATLLMSFINTSYTLPDAVPFISPAVAVTVAGVLAVITGGSSLLSARIALGQSPAALLRPKPPAHAKRVLLERFPRLWKRLPFSEKMILRNMFRSPARLLMGLIGAVGCSALILSGFGLSNSVNYVLVNHYTRTMHYDARVSLDQGLPDHYAKAIAARAGADAYEEEMITSAQAYVKGEWRVKQIYVLQDGHDMIRLYDASGAAVTLPAQGAALTRKAAEDYGLDAGDELMLRNPGGRPVSISIDLLVDLQLDQGIYLSQSAWKKLDLSPFEATHVLLESDALDTATAADMEGVTAVRTLREERDNGIGVLKIINIVALLLVLFAGALALVVFYNIGQLNFSDRLRELATLKVLGFNRGEMKTLVLRENFIITAAGLPFGLLCGLPLLKLLLTYGLPNTVQFITHIEPISWAFTVGSTLAFAFLVNLILGSRFKHINMVEALKSVE